MPVTELDLVAALVVIDLQKGIVGMQTVHPTSEIVRRSAALARAFRERGLPVVLVNVVAAAPGRTDSGPRNYAFSEDWDALVPELEQQASDVLISKRSPGAFLTTELDEILRRRDVTQIFLVGVATSIGVESTARSAYDLGYNVVFVTDAMTDRNADSHRHSLETIFPRLGETGTTDEVIGLLGSHA